MPAEGRMRKLSIRELGELEKQAEDEASIKIISTLKGDSKT